MSRNFNGTNSDHLDVAAATYTSFPFSFCAWVKLAALGAARQVFNIGSSGSADQRYALHTNATNNAVHTLRDTANVAATTSAAISDTTSWHLLSCSSLNATTHIIYLDGANKTTNSASKTATFATPVYRISASPDGLNPMSGLIAHVAMWDIVLTDAEHLALSTRVPSEVEMTSLRDYWPLDRNTSSEPSLGRDNNPMIVTGTTFSTDNPVFNPQQILMGRSGT
jgi:hypothetical protein